MESGAPTPDVRPIRFARAVDHHAGNRLGLHRGHDRLQVRLQPVVLQMIVGVVEHHCSKWARAQARMVCQILPRLLRRLGVRCWVMPKSFRKAGLVAHDFLRRLAAVELAQQHGDALDDGGIGIGPELAAAAGELGTNQTLARQPSTRKASVLKRLQGRRGATAPDDISEPVLGGFQAAQLGCQMLLLLGNGHFGARYCGSVRSSNETSGAGRRRRMKCGCARVQAAGDRGRGQAP